ncbi:hypothetical protein JOE50_007049 [Bradyrhizobium japonicum]|nr:hypothetical protein [Bradyrhizobium japonicum]
MIVKLALANVVEGEHQKPVEHNQLIVGVHTSGHLVPLPVRQLPDGVRVDFKAEDAELLAHGQRQPIFLRKKLKKRRL